MQKKKSISLTISIILSLMLLNSENSFKFRNILKASLLAKRIEKLTECTKNGKNLLNVTPNIACLLLAAPLVSQ